MRIRARAAPYAVLALLVVLFLGDTLTGHRVLALRDVIFDAVPWRRFAAAAFADGHMPLWNSTSRFGQPFLANPQSAVLYPPHLLFSVVPTATAVSLNIALHLLVAAWGTFALARRMGLGAAAAVVASTTYAFGSYMTVNLEFMSVMETLGWAPVTLLCAHRLADAGVALGRRVCDAAALAVVLALQFLPGNPQPLLYTLVCAAALLWFRLRGERRPIRAFGPVVVGAVAAGVLALGICAAQVLPTSELVALSVRADGVDPGLGIASMHPRHLLSAVAPFVDGRPGADHWHGAVFEFWLGAFHVGVPALLLALAAFVPFGSLEVRRRDAWMTRWAAGLLVVGIVLALGRFTPVYVWLLDIVPGFDRLRWPAKALQLVATSLAFLAGVGAERLFSTMRGRPRATALAGVVIALVFANLWFHARQIHATVPGALLDRRPAALDSYPGLPHERVWIDPLQTAAAYGTYGSRDEATYLAAIDVLAGETALPYGLHKSWGGDALHVAAADRLTDVLDDEHADPADVERTASRASIRWAWTASEPPRWVRRPDTYPRAFFALGPSPDLSDVRPSRALPPPVYAGNTVRISGPFPAGSLVVLTDTEFPGWTATVDGAPVEIVTVNGCFRGVRIASGGQELSFAYVPRTFVVGRRISLVSVAVTLLLLALALTLSRRGRARTA